MKQHYIATTESWDTLKVIVSTVFLFFCDSTTNWVCNSLFTSVCFIVTWELESLCLKQLFSENHCICRYSSLAIKLCGSWNKQNTAIHGLHLFIIMLFFSFSLYNRPMKVDVLILQYSIINIASNSSWKYQSEKIVK